jgi:AbiV family abortive infection protein
MDKFMKKRLNQYRGRLDATQIATGMNAANRNAVRLVKDANHLLGAGRFPSAAALAILSIEESGKTSILRELALAQDDDQVREAWRDYRSHTKKNVMWLISEVFATGARTLDEFGILFDDDSDHPFVLDQVKQISLYSDCLGAANWSIPEEIIDEDLAKSLVKIAETLAKDREVLPLEIELWMKHLLPVWMTRSDWLKGALENWYADMKKHGLKDEGQIQIEEFIRGDRDKNGPNR